MTKRKSISKKTRFEIFKRDSFACQYCGAHPPLAILEVDHIHPVAEGGTNDADNLVTACVDCNRGKSANLLSDIPQSLQDKAAMVLEREAQIKGYTAVMQAKKRRIEEDSEQVREVYERFNQGYTISDGGMVTVRRFVDSLGVHEVCGAMEYAFTRPNVKRNQEFEYFCGICWNKIRESEL